MEKDVRQNITIAQMSEKKAALEGAINDLLMAFEKEVGLPVADISVEIIYPVEGNNNNIAEPNFSRTIDVCIAL